MSSDSEGRTNCPDPYRAKGPTGEDGESEDAAVEDGVARAALPVLDSESVGEPDEPGAPGVVGIRGDEGPRTGSSRRVLVRCEADKYRKPERKNVYLYFYRSNNLIR